MNKIAKTIYSAAFFTVCCIPLAAMPFVQNSTELEKKELSKTPEIVVGGKLNENFSTDFDSWFNDRLPFRSKLLTLSSNIESGIFGETSANVISGKDGWLFYENTVADYMDTNAMSTRGTNNIAVTLSLLQEYTTNLGGKFTFVPVPNKNSIYDEFMPSRYVKADENNLTRLYGALDEIGVNYVNFEDIFADVKAGGIYHKRDTHWNYLGAMYGYNAIMDSLGEEHKSYEGLGYTLEKTWRGDLEKLLYPEGNGLDEQYKFDITFDDFIFSKPLGLGDTSAALENFMSDAEKNDTDFTSTKVNADTGRKLFMVRDSFGRGLLPFMIDNFDEAHFMRTTSPQLTNVKAGTDFVYEIVERNLSDLVSTAPFMYAPTRENLEISATSVSDLDTLNINDQSYGLQLYGVVDAGNCDDNSRIYVRLKSGESDIIYEAFPIYEQKLLSNTDNCDSSDYGYSLWINKAMLDAGEYEISVISGNIESGTLGKTIISSYE